MIRQTIHVPSEIEDNDEYIDHMRALMGQIVGAYPDSEVTITVTRNEAPLAQMQIRVMMHLMKNNESVYGIAKATGISLSTVGSAILRLESVGLTQHHIEYKGARQKKIHSLTDCGRRRAVSVLNGNEW